MTGGTFALIAAILATAAAQISYKKRSIGGSRGYLYATVAFFTVTPPLTYVAIKSLGVGLVYMSTSVTYIFVSLAGWHFFNERLDRRAIGALVLIAGGITIYAAGL